jgi:hypothetical protein
VEWLKVQGVGPEFKTQNQKKKKKKRPSSHLGIVFLKLGYICCTEGFIVATPDRLSL